MTSSPKAPKARRRWLKLTALVLVLTPLLGGCVLALAMTQPVTADKRHGPSVRADATALERHVRTIAKPRDWAHVERLDETVEYLKAELHAVGLEPTLQTWTIGEGLGGKLGGEYDAKRVYQNVRVLLPGARPDAPRVVVGAHYDSCDFLPAADDNASGVAAVLELARLLTQHPPPGPVELAFWSLEEPPLFRSVAMGSRQHADQLAKDGVVVAAALSIETIGFYRSEPGSQHYPVPGVKYLFSEVGEDIYIVGDFANASLTRRVKRAMRAGSSDPPVRSINAPQFLPGIDWSDHRSFWAHDVEAVMITDTAPNRNPNYHEASDTPDTLDYKKMAGVTEGLFEAVWVLSSAPTPPPAR